MLIKLEEDAYTGDVVAIQDGKYVLADINLMIVPPARQRGIGVALRDITKGEEIEYDPLGTTKDILAVDKFRGK